jgi:hypothetical protein
VSGSLKSSKCINCGAAVSFEEQGGVLVESVKCAFCGAVNQRAQAEALARHAEERRLELAAAARKRFVLLVSAGLAVVVVLGAAAALQQAGRALTVAHAQLEQARAQVVNVRQRQEEVLARVKDLPTTTETEAEVSGAANRVRVERRRYDEAAAAYNVSVDGPLARLAARLRGLPVTAPPSDAVSW